jgi:hypothetical protein
VQCVHPAKRRAEQARERVLQRFPPLVHPFFFFCDTSPSSALSFVAKRGEEKKKRN